MTTDLSKDIEDNKVLAAVGYVFVLCFLPLLLAKDSAYAQFHGKQALALFILEVIVLVLDGILIWIPIFGWLAIIVLKLVFLALAVLGVLKALSGEKWKMPIVSDFAEKINL
ncbi:DUF4870 domain-containing protein [Patescibacteria group bacterium]|nr:DUF4870 domain-containing protein [Patescibacteria group bacterium]